MKPPKSILDRTFKYRDSANTDVSKTWAAARKRMDEEAEKRKALLAEVRELKPGVRRQS